MPPPRFRADRPGRVQRTQFHVRVYWVYHPPATVSRIVGPLTSAGDTDGCADVGNDTHASSCVCHVPLPCCCQMAHSGPWNWTAPLMLTL